MGVTSPDWHFRVDRDRAAYPSLWLAPLSGDMVSFPGAVLCVEHPMFSAVGFVPSAPFLLSGATVYSDAGGILSDLVYAA